MQIEEAALPESPLSFMFGEWEGSAHGVGRDRKPYDITQTERVGPMLDGDVTVIEGRGYAEDGSVVFNAFAIISYDEASDSWSMRSYTGGHAGTFPFELTENGFEWSLPAGPDARINYTATFQNDTWHEVGNYTPTEGEPVQVYEMTLTRLGSSDWPSRGIVEPSTE
ncbi:MAG: hypothetical protein V3V03_06735 [Hyphomonadaceae bacterium]